MSESLDSGADSDGDSTDYGSTSRSQVNLLSILWRRQTTVALVLVLSIVVAFIYLLKVTPIYSSTSRICVEQNSPKILNSDSDSASAEKSDSFLYTQAQIVSCMPVLSTAIQAPGISDLSAFRGVDNKAAALRSMLVVAVGQKDDIISVTCNSPNPQEASMIVNSVVDAYVDYESRQNRSTAGEILKVLTSEKDKHEDILEAQEEALVNFKQTNGDVFLQTDKGNILMSAMETISNELTQAQLDEADASSRYETADDTLAAHANLVTAQARVAKYENLYKIQQAKALALNSRMAQYDKLQADVDRTSKIVDLLDSRIKELNITEDAGPLNISVLEVARPEDRPTYPKKTVTMAVAILAGLMLGTGAALLHETLDQRLRSADEISGMLGLPVLGIVPTIREGELQEGECHLQSLPTSDVSEAYRSFRTALQFGIPDQNTKTILITSPTPGDGKSTTASNLAVALAQTDRKTLLIDSDLRKPTQHKAFNVTGEMGISDVLAKRCTLEQAIQTTKVPGLDLLACGTIPPNPSEMINSHAFHKLLEEMSTSYDQVIVDSPPVIPVADARILSALCDITVLVLRAEKSTRRASRHTVELLSNVRARVIGVVMNDVSRTVSNHYGYYAGYYNYYSSNGSRNHNGHNGSKTVKESEAGRIPA